MRKEECCLLCLIPFCSIARYQCTLQHFNFFFYFGTSCLHNSDRKKDTLRVFLYQNSSYPGMQYTITDLVEKSRYPDTALSVRAPRCATNIGCDSGPERFFSFKLSPSQTAATELANHVLNMALVNRFTQVYIPDTPFMNRKFISGCILLTSGRLPA